MKHLKDYKLFESNKPVISYDFDGCLHTSVSGYDPISFIDVDEWVPFTEIHDQMRKDAKNHKIVITTARPPITNEYVWEFVKKYNLPVEEIYATDNMPKAPVLKKMGAIKHYDDHVKLIEPLREAGIEFVLVDPKTRTAKLMEEQQLLKNFLITFVNEKFFISNNTVKAFVERLRKLDPDLIHDPKHDGKGKNSRGIMVRSSALTHEQIKSLIDEFVKNYDWLKMTVVITRYA